MTKFVVDRKMWCRGLGHEKSKLLKDDGTRCCIGFVAQQCGVPDDLLLGRSSVLRFSDYDFLPGVPDWMHRSVAGIKNPAESSDLLAAYSVNDERNLPDTEREAELKIIFARHGDEIEFVGQ